MSALLVSVPWPGIVLLTQGRDSLFNSHIHNERPLFDFRQGQTDSINSDEVSYIF